MSTKTASKSNYGPKTAKERKKKHTLGGSIIGGGGKSNSEALNG